MNHIGHIQDQAALTLHRLLHVLHSFCFSSTQPGTLLRSLILYTDERETFSAEQKTVDATCLNVHLKSIGRFAIPPNMYLAADSRVG